VKHGAVKCLVWRSIFGYRRKRVKLKVVVFFLVLVLVFVQCWIEAKLKMDKNLIHATRSQFVFCLFM
jgi:multisubunit Na+/H+ antiporter MnhE subunit